MIHLTLINVDIPPGGLQPKKITIHSNCLCDTIPPKVRRGIGTKNKSIEDLGIHGGWFGRLLLKKDLEAIGSHHGKLNFDAAKDLCSGLFKSAFRTIEAIGPNLADFEVSLCC